ncbi:hypothetical protein O3P69_003068 [Scylla paramamosain]|uniref:Uncharacterized protein n=1 Tax=Scylla paramamosain TaxID=85552 RepID=A0AAW0UPK2_SCYPA
MSCSSPLPGILMEVTHASSTSATVGAAVNSSTVVFAMGFADWLFAAVSRPCLVSLAFWSPYPNSPPRPVPPSLPADYLLSIPPFLLRASGESLQPPVRSWWALSGLHRDSRRRYRSPAGPMIDRGLRNGVCLRWSCLAGASCRPSTSYREHRPFLGRRGLGGRHACQKHIRFPLPA